MTRDVVVIAIKALAGGTLVVLLSLVGGMLRPRWFAGLLSAAPSIALASLVVTVTNKGDHAATLATIGMLFGAVGFVAFALITRPLLGRMSTVMAASVATAVWACGAVGGYFVILR